MAERYLYLPSFGFSIFLAFLIFKIPNVGLLKNYKKIITIFLVIFISGIFLSLTIQRNAVWKDNFTLLSTTVDKNPLGTRTNHALALYYRGEGDYESATKYALRAVELSARNYNAYENLGTINAYLKKYDDAIKYYNKSLELDPDFYLANNNLGLVYSYIGDINKSIFYLKKAIQINPGISKAHNDLGTVYASNGELDKAIVEIKKAIEINPYDADYPYNLAIIYLSLGEQDQAENLLAKGLDLDPENNKIKSKLNDISP